MGSLKPSILLVVLGCFLAANCGSQSEDTSNLDSTSKSAPSDLIPDVTVELSFIKQDDFKEIEPGVCVLRETTARSQDLNNGSEVLLIGPNGAKVAASRFGSGVMAQPKWPDDGQILNYPKHDICTFTATFFDVKKVPHYRLEFYESGVGETLYDLNQIERFRYILLIEGALTKESTKNKSYKT